MVAIAFVYALAAAALVVVFPNTFAGHGLLWLLPAVPALAQAEILAAAALHALTSPTITGRVWFAVMQVLAGLLAAGVAGWPRAVAATAAALMLVEISVGKLVNPPPGSQP